MVVKQRAAGVAGVDGTVGLDHVHLPAVAHGDGAVEGRDDAGSLGEGELTQGVADGGDFLPHQHVAGSADDHGGQAGGVDLDNGDVVGLFPADVGGVILGAVYEGNLDGTGPVDDVVVGEDITVLGDDKAGTCCRAGHRLAKDVGADDVHRDAHAGVYILGIDLCHGELLLGVHRSGVHLGGGAVSGVDGGGTTAGNGGVQGVGHQAACQGAHQAQSNDLQGSLGLFAHGLALFRAIGHFLIVERVDVPRKEGGVGRERVVLEPAGSRFILVVVVVIHEDASCTHQIFPASRVPLKKCPCFFLLWTV